MPLLEIVVGEKTSDAALARALDVAVQIVRQDADRRQRQPRLLHSRVIGKFLEEAMAMLGEARPASVEQAASRRATGPASPLMDELTLTLPRKIRRSSPPRRK